MRCRQIGKARIFDCIDRILVLLRCESIGYISR
jgi:hypothetical protein